MFLPRIGWDQSSTPAEDTGSAGPPPDARGVVVVSYAPSQAVLRPRADGADSEARKLSWDLANASEVYSCAQS